MTVIGGDNIQERIIAAIKADNTISATQIAELVKVSKRTIERNIKELREKGVLERHGAARGGYWEVRICLDS